MSTFFRSLVLLALLSTMGHAKELSEQGFNDYLKTLIDEAVEQGYEPQWLTEVKPHISYRATVVKADKNQPERKITLDNYLASRVPDWKVEQAVSLLNEHQQVLNQIADEYGVQARYIVALWGNESNFGRIQGNHSILSATASLAYEGRREDFFKQQFFAALTILKEGHASIDDFNGSWAGAMGQSQFIPTTFLQYAVDYDRDGKKDIWHNYADVFASIANYLSKHGWSDEATWGRQVTVPDNFDFSLAELGRAPAKEMAHWQQLGVRRYDGSDLPQADINASLIAPDGPKGRIYLVYDNFYTLMRWNRSQYFGVSVGYLSDRIKRGF